MRRQREKSMHRRDALLELTRLVQSPTAPAMMSRVTELVAHTLGAHRISVWRLENGGADLVCQDLFAQGTHHSGERLARQSFPHYFRTLHEEPIIVVEDARTDPRTREFLESYLVPNDIRSLLDVPLRFHGHPSGVLCIEHAGETRAWDAEDQNFAVGVADQLTIMRETTERLRAEQALREAHADLEIRVMLRTTELAEARDRAEAADRLKSAFLATMSHELRTPLNSIIGFTGILLQGLVGPLTAEQKKQLGMVQNSARHLLSLINDVLDISKIEAGQVELAPAPFDLRDTVHHVVELVRPLADRKGLRLELQVAPGVGTGFSDRRRVEQILINLVNNAIKFTESGSVRLECDQRDGQMQVAIHDTGIGIRDEDLPRLFKPFRQLDSGLARQHEGTGLGLAICAGLTKLLKGSIDVTSTYGQGSTFRLTLPPAEKWGGK
ncbi:MAG: GAF domain-containing protein [Verrucomicrobiales bacterium]|nr:GAF domain-containing protein [Verrucomicrobiales bacterium]